MSVLTAMALVLLGQRAAKHRSSTRQVIWIPSPFFNERPAGTVIDTVVIHHTSLATLNEVVQRFQNPEFKVSSHYIIDRDGTVVQMVDLSQRAYHAGKSIDVEGRPNVNDFSIGIELVNTGVGAEPYPARQISSLTTLITQLKRKHKIRIVTSHEYVAEPVGRKNDPFAFPWMKLKRLGLKMVYGTKKAPVIVEPQAKMPHV
jgi:N-acetyl-anhydromuramyl-L-alanine amidase AmpD